MKTDNLDRRLISYEALTKYIIETADMKDENGKEIETPQEEVSYLAKRLNGIIGQLNTTSIPWGTGGETGYYTEASFGWSVIYVTTLTFIQGVQFLLKQDKIANTHLINKTPDTAKTQDVTNLVYTHRVHGLHIDITSLVDTLKYFYFKYYIQYALKMSYISWFGRDIVPQQVALISNIPERRGGGISLEELDAYQKNRDDKNDG